MRVVVLTFDWFGFDKRELPSCFPQHADMRTCGVFSWYPSFFLFCFSFFFLKFLKFRFFFLRSIAYINSVHSPFCVGMLHMRRRLDMLVAPDYHAVEP